jgi:hypothetical protein
MKGSIHLYSSAVLGGMAFKASQSVGLSIATFLSGFLLDIDHIADFMFLSGENFTINNMFSWCDNGRWEKVFLLFHSYEFYFLLGVTTYFLPYKILIGFLCGTGLHLILDQIWNCHLRKDFLLSPWFYFLTYRVYAKFHKDKLQMKNQLCRGN